MQTPEDHLLNDRPAYCNVYFFFVLGIMKDCRCPTTSHTRAMWRTRINDHTIALSMSSSGAPANNPVIATDSRIGGTETAIGIANELGIGSGIAIGTVGEFHLLQS